MSLNECNEIRVLKMPRLFPNIPRDWVREERPDVRTEPLWHIHHTQFGRFIGGIEMQDQKIDEPRFVVCYGFIIVCWALMAAGFTAAGVALSDLYSCGTTGRVPEPAGEH